MWLCSSCHRVRTEFLNLFMFCSCCHCWHLHWSLVQLQHLLWTHYWKWAPGCLKMSSIARHVLSIAFPSSTCYLKLGEHQSQSLVFWCVFGFGCWCSRFDHQMYSLLQVLPTVIKLFASSDRAIRVGLLQHIESFGGGLSTQVVDEQVSYPTYVHQHTRLA